MEQLKLPLDYQIGSWLRAYSTSLRGDTAPTELGQVIGYGVVKDWLTRRPTEKSVIIKNRLVTVEVPFSDIIGEVDIKKLAAELGVLEVPDFITPQNNGVQPTCPAAKIEQ